MLKSDNIISQNQYLVARVLSWFMILILILRYFQIQIIEHEIYSLKSNTNRIRKVSKNAPRGLILDRHGDILVDNYPVYVLTAIPGEMNNKKKQFSLIADYIDSDSIVSPVLSYSIALIKCSVLFSYTVVFQVVSKGLSKSL